MPVYDFSSADITSCHKLVAENNQIYNFAVLEVKSLKCICRSVFFLEVLGDDPLPCLFLPLEDSYIPWLILHSSIYKASSVTSLISASILRCFADSSFNVSLL